MNKSSKLLIVIVTAFLLAGCFQVECRRTYSSRSSSSGRGNRGKNQPSGGGLFGSWFGGSKSSGSSSGSVSKPVQTSSSSSAKKNWQTATSHTTGQQSKSGWANPNYKPAGSVVPSAPKEANYGWKPAPASNSKVGGSSLPSSNIGSRGYPVQSGVQQTGGFKPVASAPSIHTATNHQPSQSSYGGYKPASGYPNTQYQPSSVHGSSNIGGYHSAPGATNTAYKPSNTYQQPPGYHQPSYGAPHSSYNAPSYHAPSYHPPGGHAPSYHPSYTGGHAPSYHPSGGHAPSYYSSGGHAPSYHSPVGHGFSHQPSYSYPGSGNWGLSSYGSKRSSGTGKLLTGLAVGAAGGYLTSSLVNRISNPWKYSGYGYGSGFGYGSGIGVGSGLGYGSGLGVSDYGLSRSESAFERGYERGVRDRNEKAKDNATPPPAPPEPEDPTKNWVSCVAFDPQTQQTLINPNCSCTVTTSQDERNGQPISVHHCTTLNGLVMKPFIAGERGDFRGLNQEPNQGVSPGVNSESSQGVNQGVGQGINQGGSQGVNQGVNTRAGQGQPQIVTINGQPISFGAYGPPPGLEIEPSYGESSYGGSAVYSPTQMESKNTETQAPVKIEGSTSEGVSEQAVTEKKAEEITTEAKSEGSTTGGGIQNESEKSSALHMSTKMTGVEEGNKSKEEFYGQLQKIVNMGKFV